MRRDQVIAPDYWLVVELVAKVVVEAWVTDDIVVAVEQAMRLEDNGRRGTHNRHELILVRQVLLNGGH